MANGVAEQGFRPFQLADQLFGVRVDQQFVVVKAMAILWVIRAVHAVAIDLPRMGIRQIAVIGLVGVLG